IRLNQARRKCPTGWRDNGDSRESLCDVEVRHLAIFFRVWAGVLIAQAESEGQIGKQSPIILHVARVRDRSEVIAAGAEAHRTGLRETKQEIGKVIASSRQRIARAIEPASGKASERK